MFNSVPSSAGGADAIKKCRGDDAWSCTCTTPTQLVAPHPRVLERKHVFNLTSNVLTFLCICPKENIEYSRMSTGGPAPPPQRLTACAVTIMVLWIAPTTPTPLGITAYLQASSTALPSSAKASLKDPKSNSHLPPLELGQRGVTSSGL
jgi:hypothetical protein